MSSESLAQQCLVELTEAQTRQIFEETGIVMRHIHATRASFVGMVIAAEFLRSGGSTEHGRQVLLRLDEAQQGRLQADLGTAAPALLFALEGDVKYYETWTNEFPLVELGQRLRVLPSGAPGPGGTDDLIVRLVTENTQRGVFGTGRHATTRMAARLLEKWIEPGVEAADVGTGSGILAIAAAMLGAHHVLALEIDDKAVERARENVALNGLTDSIDVEGRAFDGHSDGPFHLVIANLFPDVLIPLGPALAASLHAAGILVFSGVVARRIAEVVDVLQAQGLETVDQQSDGVWTARAMRKLP